MTQPPETAEGWYVVHQALALDRAAWRALGTGERLELREGAARALEELARPEEGGWSAAAVLVGSEAELLLVHFRPTLEALDVVQRRLRREAAFDHLKIEFAFLSVAEAGFYGRPVDRESEHVRRRLYPELPAEMPYVSFYPMSKRRVPEQNWYALALEERSRLMQAHGATGRRYAGRVSQIISGAIGLDAWEWGVTLFARDPVDIKKLVTEMRFDEVSAQYAEFGRFFFGKLAAPAEAMAAVLGED